MKKTLFIIALALPLLLSACKITRMEGDCEVAVEEEKTESAIVGKNAYEFKILKFDVRKYWKDYEYFGIVEFKNTGKESFYFASGQFVLEDGEGKLLQINKVKSFPQIVRPGEKAYLYNVGKDRDIDSSIDIRTMRLRPEFTLKKTDVEPRNFEISKVELREDDFSVVVQVGVRNNSSDDVRVNVDVVFFNAGGEIVEMAHRSLHSLKPGEEADFEISSMELKESIGLKGIGSYEVKATEYLMLD